MSKKIKILVVEDDIGDFTLLKGTLDQEITNVFNLIHVDSLEKAFKRLDEEDFDLILLDLALPDSMGLDTVTKINDKRPQVPVVVLTGLDDKEVGIATVKKGAQDFLIKGQITYDYFFKSVNYALERVRLENFKNDIVNNISHELRTPLTIVRESISQVSDGIFGDINEKQDKYLKMALTNIDRLKKIIDNLLDMSKIDAGKLEIFKEKIVVAVLFEDLVADFLLKVKAKENLNIKNSTLSEKLEIFADRDNIIQVFTNLVGNALKFTDKGLIEVSATEKDNFVECRVKDSGIGISEEDLPRIFGKFDQIGRQSGPGGKGTGLGLAISKSIIELHGGSIYAESEKGKGSTFVFTLPKKE